MEGSSVSVDGPPFHPTGSAVAGGEAGSGPPQAAGRRRRRGEGAMSSPERWSQPQPSGAPAATAAAPTAEQVIAGLRATSEGGPELVQLLTPEGERVENPEWDRYVADVTADDLRSLYRDMVLTRRVDREANALQRQGQLSI